VEPRGGAALAAQRLIGSGGDGRVYLGHQVCRLVQEHSRDGADQVRSLRRQGWPTSGATDI
jgi:hypothetical protein